VVARQAFCYAALATASKRPGWLPVLTIASGSSS
jgi:mannose/cellobiose epimerase-like protein (N-acyl-D-glucosamine 2-epimerase family)